MSAVRHIHCNNGRKENDAGKETGSDRIQIKGKAIYNSDRSGRSHIIFALGAFLFLIMPEQVSVSESDVVNGRVFPRLLFLLMMICSLILIIQNVSKLLRKEPVQTYTFHLLTEIKALLILGILIMTYLICKVTDLFVLGAVFCAVSFLLYFRCRKKAIM